MSIRVPLKRVRKEFLLAYELEGCRKAVALLAEYYGTRKMKIILDGRRVGKGNVACYFKNKAYFAPRGLNRRTVLHEWYHHIVSAKGLEMSGRTEEKEANLYARDFLRNHD